MKTFLHSISYARLTAYIYVLYYSIYLSLVTFEAWEYDGWMFVASIFVNVVGFPIVFFFPILATSLFLRMLELQTTKNTFIGWALSFLVIPLFIGGLKLLWGVHSCKQFYFFLLVVLLLPTIPCVFSLKLRYIISITATYLLFFAQTHTMLILISV